MSMMTDDKGGFETQTHLDSEPQVRFSCFLFFISTNNYLHIDDMYDNDNTRD